MVGWRDVPVDDAYVGRHAGVFAPVIRQLFVAAAPGLEPGRLRAQALRDPPRRRARRGRRPRDPELLLAHARLQGHADRAATARLLPRPQRRALRERAGTRALALLDEHLSQLGARASVPHGRAQRRDQHAARQRQLDACARVAARVRALRQRHREGAAGRPARRLRHRGLRQRARAARARRPLAAARADDDGAGGVCRARRRARRAARLLRVPRLPDRGLGRAGSDRVHRRAR